MISLGALVSEEPRRASDEELYCGTEVDGLRGSTHDLVKLAAGAPRVSGRVLAAACGALGVAVAIERSQA